MLKGLKDNGFHIVQVVPSPAYLIAMAAKPQTRMLASAVPEELNIDGGALPPAWPPALPQRADNFTPDDVALPAPDASAFEPDSGVSEDNADVHWPAQPEAVPPAPDEKKSVKHSPLERPQAHAAVHEHRRAERPHGRSHQRAGADDQSTGVAVAGKGLRLVVHAHSAGALRDYSGRSVAESRNRSAFSE